MRDYASKRERPGTTKPFIVLNELEEKGAPQSLLRPQRRERDGRFEPHGVYLHPQGR
jgi:hypothetical protein